MVHESCSVLIPVVSRPVVENRLFKQLKRPSQSLLCRSSGNSRIHSSWRFLGRDWELCGHIGTYNTRTPPGCEYIPRSDPPSSVYCLRSLIFSALGREEETIPHPLSDDDGTHSQIRIFTEAELKILFGARICKFFSKSPGADINF